MFIVFCYKDMHTVINYSFANLALTDLTLLLLDGLPTAADTMGTNFSASLGCNIPIYLQYVTAEVTSLTLAFLSYDRYQLIVHPIKSLSRRSPKTILKMFAGIWLVSFLIQVPVALVAGPTASGSCSEFYLSSGEQYFFAFETASLYCIPLAIIIFCYATMGRKMLAAGPRSSIRRRRSVNSILFVIILYVLCWLPVHVVHLWMAFDPEVEPTDALYTELHTAANVLLFMNSSVNPFVYTLGGPSYRRHIKTLAISIVKCRFNQPDPRRQQSISRRSGAERSSDAYVVNNRPKPSPAPSTNEPVEPGSIQCSSTWL
ncbi:G-protein coupled receptor 54-like [Asterias rubens]|uniref:G-protein coupled receptor 54-like n=1 Tax=Asterias rubens TaxID=7604 RepID=UPI001455355A|nr:G-protein coupled receptor 54-like [Asterias rubens]